MNKMLCLSVAAVLIAQSAFAEAADKYYPGRTNQAYLGNAVSLNQAPPLPELPPAPGSDYESMPTTQMSPEIYPEVYMEPGQQPVPAPYAMTLYSCVRYKDKCRIAPCAVSMIVSVPDPCACVDPCSCCPTPCVNVEICVPPCECPRIKVCRKGTKYIYDYGKYEVEITSRNGKITVDYDS